jgi:hypothetical protein
MVRAVTPRHLAAVLSLILFTPVVALSTESLEQYGPWSRDLELWESTDGKRFLYRGVFAERGGVPTLAKMKDGRFFAAFQWFPLDQQEAFDRIAVKMSADGGESWSEPQPITIEGMPRRLHRSFDPTLVALADGSLRLYFTSERGDERSFRGNRAIFSAISDDGVTYLYEPGQRFGLPDEEAYDSAVAQLSGIWHLYCPRMETGGLGFHAVSPDGKNFMRVDDVIILGSRQWLGSVLAAGEQLHFYGTGQGGGWRASSFDGAIWQLDLSVNFQGADPAAVVLEDDRILLITTGPLRPDAQPGPPPLWDE